MKMSKNEILANAKYCKDGNIKLGKTIISWSKLYGNNLYDVPGVGVVSGTCGKYCAGCEKECYVKKSYRYKSVIKSHAVRTIATRLYIDELTVSLDNQLTNMKKKSPFCRIHQSGEIETTEELNMHVIIAKNHPETVFYLYTKAFDIVSPFLLASENNLPENLVILYSIWHEYGIKEYNEVKHIKNIKAFVYDDNNYDYAKHGIIIDTYCKAYDNAGKLDHNITCDKCKKCMIIHPAIKIIGCKAH